MVGAVNKTPGTTGLPGVGETSSPSSQGAAVGGGVGGGGGAVPDATFGGQIASLNTLLTEFQSEVANLPDVPGGLENGLSEEQRSLLEGEIAKLIGSLVGTFDDLSELLVKFAAMGRQNALDQRLEARDAAKGNMMGEAAEIREAAQKQITGAIISMVVAVVTAAISIAAAGLSIQGAAGATKAAGKAGEVADEAAQAAKIAGRTGGEAGKHIGRQADALNVQAQQLASQVQQISTKAQALSGIAQTISQLATSIAGGTKTILDSAAMVDQAEGKEMAAQAQEDQSNSDLAKKVMDDLEEMIRAAIQFLKEMQRAEVDLMANMTRV